MPDPNLTIRRSRGFDSLIRGKTLDNYMREAIKEEVEPVVVKEYDKYISRFGLKPKVKTNVQVGQVRGQVLTVRIVGNSLAVSRWNMIDTEGRKGGKIIKSTKFKTVRKKSAGKTKTKKNAAGVTITTRVTTGSDTYKRYIPMPLRRYNSKIVRYGEPASGDGTYEDSTVGAGEELLFRTKVRQGSVKPLHITRDYIAPALRKEMTRSVENAYRRAFRAITGRGI